MLNKHVLCITNFEDLYWSRKSNRWVKLGESNNDVLYSYATGIKTLRAARRRVKKWAKYLPVNTKFIVVYKYSDNVIPVTLRV